MDSVFGSSKRFRDMKNQGIAKQHPERKSQ